MKKNVEINLIIQTKRMDSKQINIWKLEKSLRLAGKMMAGIVRHFPKVIEGVSRVQVSGGSGSWQPVEEKSNYHLGHKNNPVYVHNTCETLVKYIFLSCEMSDNTTLCSFDIFSSSPPPPRALPHF